MIELVSSTESLLSLIPSLQQYIKQDKAKLAVDFETFNPEQQVNWEELEEDEEAPDRDKSVPRPVELRNGEVSGQIRLLQLGLDPNPSYEIRDKVYVIDVQAIGYKVVGDCLRPILENCQIVGQNLKYEYQFAWVHLGIDLGKNKALLDLMLMSQVLYGGDKVNHGLGELFHRYFELGWFISRTGMTFEQYKEFKKKHQDLDWRTAVLTPEELNYAAWDVELLFPLLDHMRDAIQDWRQAYEYNFEAGRGMIPVILLENQAIPAFAFMELRGIKLDVRYQMDVVVRYLSRKRDDAENRVGFQRTITKKRSNGKRGLNRQVWTEDVTEPINMRSWQQLKPRVNEMLADDTQDEAICIENTAEKSIREVVNRHRDILSDEVKERLFWLLQYKKATSLLSKFGEKLVKLSGDRGYIYPGWFQIGTDESSVSSGRSTCKNPNMMQMPSRGVQFVTKFDAKNRPVITYDAAGVPEDGINVVQFFRRSFIAEDGWVLIDADYSQEEPRIATDFCGEKNMEAEFLKPGKVDVHSIIGKSMCGLDYYPQKGDYERDYIGKTAGLQLLYGAYWTSLKQFMFDNTDGKVNWSDSDAENAYNRFFGDYPAFKKKMEQVGADMRRAAEEAGHSLAPFKEGRRPFAVAWTYMGRVRRFCLTKEQCNMSDSSLERKYRKPVIDLKTKKQKVDAEGKPVFTNYNTYKERLSSASREGFNHTIQGSSADILKVAVVNIHREFLEAGFHWKEGIVAVVHDEILCHVKREHREQAKEILVRNMKKAFESQVKKIPCEVEVKEGFSWSEAKG